MGQFTVMTSAAIAAFLLVPVRSAEVTLTLKRIHMCCEGCAEEVTEILKKVEGVSGVSTNEKTTSATFTARDASVAQQALDALAAGGFHGDPGDTKGIAFKNDSGVKPGLVKRLTVTGFHNTCGGCVKSFRDAIRGVKGVTGDNAKAKVTTATVTGEFDAAALVKAINDAGFHVTIGKSDGRE
jgi:mercuric ion binding protein